MANTPGLAIGPMDPDAAGELTKKLGVHNKADRLLNRHRAMYPVDLLTALSRPVDAERTAALDLDEVREALESLTGRRAFFNADREDVLLDASVRQDNTDKRRNVAVLYESGKSGRSMRGVIPYELCPASIRRYAQLKEEEATYGTFDPARRTTALTGTVEEFDTSGFEEQLRALEARVRTSEEGAATTATELARLRDPEPYEGYDEAGAEKIIATVSDNGRDQFGVVGLERMLDYEERHKNRVTVKNAIDGELSKTPAGEN